MMFRRPVGLRLVGAMSTSMASFAQSEYLSGSFELNRTHSTCGRPESGFAHGREWLHIAAAIERRRFSPTHTGSARLRFCGWQSSSGNTNRATRLPRGSGRSILASAGGPERMRSVSARYFQRSARTVMLSLVFFAEGLVNVVAAEVKLFLLFCIGDGSLGERFSCVVAVFYDQASIEVDGSCAADQT